MGEFWHWIVVGFAFGVGFTLGSAVISGLLGVARAGMPARGIQTKA